MLRRILQDIRPLKADFGLRIADLKMKAILNIVHKNVKELFPVFLCISLSVSVCVGLWQMQNEALKNIPESCIRDLRF